MPYVSPSFKGSAFNCPHCDAYSSMSWHQLTWRSIKGMNVATPIYRATCTHCNKDSFWHGPEGKGSLGRMIIPEATIAPLPHPDMPEEIKADYEEARNISAMSPRGAAALLRLAIQKLCVELGETGDNLNDDIGSLVKKGLPVQIKNALDIVRVIGNNAVHPGVLSPDDVADVAATLFDLVNYIVEDRIARPKKIEGIYESLPSGALEAIEKRDAEK